jgi:hypothetical protein
MTKPIDQSESAAMSVVIVTPDSFDTIARTIARLRAQTVAQTLEVVIVAPSVDELALDATVLIGFFGYRVVTVGRIESIAHAYAAGIEFASAPIVALAEDHSFPVRGWAKALIVAHRQYPNAAAVGPAICNANPGTRVSWADLYIGYGAWLHPQTAGIRSHLPGHNSSYKRDALLTAYGDRLGATMEAETVMQWDLRAKGHELYLEPAARTYHTNFGLLSSWIPVQYHGGRVFAAARSRTWSIWKRIAFSGGAPLIPFVRARRILRDVPKTGPPHRELLRTLPMLMFGLALDAIGQMVGTLVGAGASRRKLSLYEFHRERHVPELERRREIADESDTPHALA